METMTPTKTMTPEEMEKHLYSLMYRHNGNLSYPSTRYWEGYRDAFHDIYQSLGIQIPDQYK